MGKRDDMGRNYLLILEPVGCRNSDNYKNQRTKSSITLGLFKCANKRVPDLNVTTLLLCGIRHLYLLILEQQVKLFLPAASRMMCYDVPEYN